MSAWDNAVNKQFIADIQEIVTQVDEDEVGPDEAFYLIKDRLEDLG